MKVLSIIGVVIIVLLGALSSQASIDAEMASEEPTAVEVQKAALAYHNMEEREVSSWKRRAKLSALLPRFQVEYDRRVKNDVDIDIGNNVYVGSSGVTVGPDEGTYSQNANSDQNVGVKAVWFLGELIFNPDQLDISREGRNVMRERQMLLAEVNKHYYERQKLRGIIATLEGGTAVPVEGNGTGQKQKKDVLIASMDPKHQLFLAKVRFEEETAALDALTGGWFSSQLGR